MAHKNKKQCLISAVHGNVTCVLLKKVAIARFEGVGLLNKRTELLCRHRNKFIIANIK